MLYTNIPDYKADRDVVLSAIWTACRYFAALTVILFIGTGCDDEKKPSEKIPVMATQKVVPDTPLMEQLRQENAFLKTQKILQAHTVNRYRNMMFLLPENLSEEEKTLLEQYRITYRNLRMASMSLETELLLDRYETISVQEQRFKLLIQKQHLVSQRKASVSVGKQAKKITSQTVKKAVASQKLHKKAAAVLSREVNALHRQLYAITSQRLLVTNVRDKDKYASEFANAVKLQENWLRKNYSKYASGANKEIKDILFRELRLLNLLKDCRTVHEFTYKGGEKMKGVRIGRFQIIDTGWKGIEFFDLRGKFESRLKTADLTPVMRRHLAAAGAVRTGKQDVKFNKISLLAYYHILSGEAAILGMPEMKLTAEEKQQLLLFFQFWGISPEMQNALTERKD